MPMVAAGNNVILRMASGQVSALVSRVRGAVPVAYVVLVGQARRQIEAAAEALAADHPAGVDVEIKAFGRQ